VVVETLALAALVVFAPPEVTGSGDCPSAAMVAARLAPLLPPGDDAARGDLVELEAAGDATLVRLRDPEGNVVNERRTAASTCAERADEVALLIAIWEADLHADVAFPPLAPPVVDEAPPVAAPAPRVDAPPPAAAPVTRVQAAPPAPPSRWAGSVGGALALVAPASAGVAPAGWIEATLSAGGPVGARVALGATGEHQLALPPGTVSWRRVSLGLGPVAELALGRARLSIRAGALVAAVIARGSGFSQDQSATSWQLGGEAAARGGWALTPRLGLWADAGLAVFPGTVRVSVSNVTEKPTVPRWATQAAIGATYWWSP
jgi:hypothetical protein